MKSKKILYVGALFALVSSVYAFGRSFESNCFEKLMARCAQSDFAKKFNQLISLPPNGSPATETLQNLCLQAQEAVGIVPEERVPVFMFDGGELGEFAYADAGAIYVNSASKDPFSVQRCNMHHEAVHIKYNDLAVTGLVKIGFGSWTVGLVAGGLSGAKVLKSVGSLSYLLTPVAALCAGYMVAKIAEKKYENYRERRADIEGHYATNCHVCVREKAHDIQAALDGCHDIIKRNSAALHDLKDRGELTDDVRVSLVRGIEYARNYIRSQRTNGYLSPEENLCIADDLELEDKVCAYHQ